MEDCIVNLTSRIPLFSDVPNFAFVVGYTNASWTLKADIASLYFAKLINYMRANKVAKVVPREDPSDPVNSEAFDGGLSSGYFARAKDILPKQGDRSPWRGLTTRTFNAQCVRKHSQDHGCCRTT